MKNSNSRKGFTLTELLVVIVIVATLASLGFAGARKGLMAARAATTVTNLKQIGTAIHSIREEGLRGDVIRPGVFPPYAGFMKQPHQQFNILELIAENQGYCVADPPKYKWSVMPSETILQNPLSKKTLGGTAKKTSGVNLSTTASQCYGSYSYNAWIEGYWNLYVEVDPTSTQPRMTRVDGVNRQSREILHPGRTIMMGETSDTTPSPVYTGWENTAVQGNYKDRAHCVFVDNHVESISNKVLKSADGLKKYMQTTWR